MEKFEKTVDNGGVSQIMTKVVTISVPAVIKTITVTGSVIICFISVVYLSVVIDNVRDWKKENVFRMEIKAVSDSLYRLIQVYFKIEAYPQYLKYAKHNCIRIFYYKQSNYT